MGKDTNISWTDSTLNLAWGCTKVSTECMNCYLYRLSPRFGRDPYKVQLTRAGWLGNVRRAQIVKCGKRIFINSMSDTFHDHISDLILDYWFADFAAFPEKQFQILTKRPERAAEYFCSREVPENCWIGTSVGIAEVKHRIDTLRQIKAKVRFLSCEPVLEDLGDLNLTGIKWVIVGGESDPSEPRPMKPEWAESIRKQCEDGGVAFWFKQMGGKGGSGAGGDLLNGLRYQEFPES